MYGSIAECSCVYARECERTNVIICIVSSQGGFWISYTGGDMTVAGPRQANISCICVSPHAYAHAHKHMYSHSQNLYDGWCAQVNVSCVFLTPIHAHACTGTYTLAGTSSFLFVDHININYLHYLQPPANPLQPTGGSYGINITE